MPVRVTPRTDDKPYFAMLRKTPALLHADPANYLDEGTAEIVNEQVLYSKGVPMDWIHLIFTGIASVFFIVVFVAVPLRFSSIARKEGATTVPLLVYFSCLGAGFIGLELVFIQKFTHVIGSPLYTYSTVLFSMLSSAGIGSAASERLGISPRRRWQLPFAAIIVLGVALMLLYPAFAHLALALPLASRVAAVAAMIFPVGFFLGMPFPLGILAIANHPRGAISWAWGMNGLFTVTGGFFTVLISIGYGFDRTIVVALALYALAWGAYGRLLRDGRSTDSAVAVVRHEPVDELADAHLN
jgi:hypothetical protein